MTAKTKTQDPVAVVHKVIVDAVDTLSANQEKAAAAATANLDATVTAGKIITDAAEQAGALVKDHVAGVSEDRIAGFKQVLAASDVQTAAQVHADLLKVEQDKAMAFVDAVAKLATAAINDAFNPIQAQAAANLELVIKAKAA